MTQLGKTKLVAQVKVCQLAELPTKFWLKHQQLIMTPIGLIQLLAPQVLLVLLVHEDLLVRMALMVTMVRTERLVPQVLPVLLARLVHKALLVWTDQLVHKVLLAQLDRVCLLTERLVKYSLRIVQRPTILLGKMLLLADQLQHWLDLMLQTVLLQRLP